MQKWFMVFKAVDEVDVETNGAWKNGDQMSSGQKKGKKKEIDFGWIMVKLLRYKRNNNELWWVGEEIR